MFCWNILILICVRIDGIIERKEQILKERPENSTMPTGKCREFTCQLMVHVPFYSFDRNSVNSFKLVQAGYIVSCCY